MASPTVTTAEPFTATLTELSGMRGHLLQVAAYTDVTGARVTGLPSTLATVKARAQYRTWLPVSWHPDGTPWTAFKARPVSLATGRLLVIRQVTL